MSRRTARFDVLTGAELLTTLHAWHPLLRDADEQLLQRIDARYCHGNFRDWADVEAWAHGIAHELAPVPAGAH